MCTPRAGRPELSRVYVYVYSLTGDPDNSRGLGWAHISVLFRHGEPLPLVFVSQITLTLELGEVGGVRLIDPFLLEGKTRRRDDRGLPGFHS